MAAAEEIGVAEEVVVETMRPAKKRAWLLKKGVESACKCMLLLVVDPELKAKAMPLIVTKVEADAIHFEAGRTCGNEHRHPSFHHAPHRWILDLLQTNMPGRHHN